MVQINTAVFERQYNGLSAIEIEKTNKTFKFANINVDKAINVVNKSMDILLKERNNKGEYWNIIGIKNA